MAHCLIGLGSNLGDLLASARDMLAALPQTSLISISSFHESKPAGGPATQPPYLNAAALLESSFTPQQLLAELQRIENSLGRERMERWGPRTIDLDLLLYDELELETPELTLPHPRMSFRRFVLEPAAEIAAEMVYPINGWTIGRLESWLRISKQAIALAPFHSKYFAKSPATALLRKLEIRKEVQPVFQVDSVTPPKSRADRLRNRHRTAEREKRQPDLVKVGASWLITNFWVGQACVESFAELPIWREITAKSFEGKDSIRLVVVWHSEPVADLRRLDFVRRLPQCGPVLWIPGVSLERAEQEVIAAMAAMA
jgi:2-amino-4-hydroxy-6-hydroxymethyldihydropteridine diphosphokinase